MNARDIRLVQFTFELIAPDADMAAESFYRHLFTLDPSLRSMFRGSIEEQGRKLMQILAVVVRGLDKLDTLLPAVRALGERHAKYGVQPKHFDTVATALLTTLAEGLGAVFTQEVRDAWTTAYVTLATVMIEAASNVTHERVA
jgi:hemoglobin-like flavoprotein